MATSTAMNQLLRRVFVPVRQGTTICHQPYYLRVRRHYVRSVAPFSSGKDDGSSSSWDANNQGDPHAMFKEQMDQLKQEREELYGFTEEENNAWSSLESGAEKLSSSLLESVEEARAEARAGGDMNMNVGATNTNINTNTDDTTTNDKNVAHDEDDAGDDYQPTHGLTHLSEDGSSANMVDVGHKTITQRMARAETKVILPPEVTDAFQVKTRDEVVGPKGAVFATARIAGIMAAKKTSDLIPLCHPLPLDKVQIDIHMKTDDTVLISCECRVTHKTGVEMEALTGATVAALTVYDMLKALSHNIRIEQTVLVSKSGGKRTVG